MKIMIYGYSGSGKSTISKIIGKEYSLPILYVDHTLYKENWEKKTSEETLLEMQSFLKKNNNWIIDGNAARVLFKERAKLADKIIFMNFSRWECYKNAKKRFKEYKNKPRESRPEGCNEKFDFSFKHWILFKGRNRKRTALLESILDEFREKCIVLTNKKEVENFLSNLDNYLLK